MTTTAHSFLERSRRELIRIIALALVIGCSVITIIMAGLLLVLPDRTMLISYIAVLLFALIGSALTLALIRRRPIGTAILPLVIAIIVGVFVSSRLLPETTLVSVPLLAVVVLLVSLGQRRNLTLTIGGICAALGAVLAGYAPPGDLAPAQLRVGDALPAVYIVGATTLIAVIWLVAARLISTADTAIQLADHRAGEAEMARGAAEEARAALQQRAVEQQQLLDLVTVLETPTIKLDDSVLLAPIVGQLDSTRLARVTQHLLQTVYHQRVTLVIFDITGVPKIDSSVAQGLLETARALRLLGCSIQMSGFSAETAMALTHLNISADELPSARSLQEALLTYR